MEEGGRGEIKKSKRSRRKRKRAEIRGWRRGGFWRMWSDNGRKDGPLEKWYAVRKDNEARAGREPRDETGGSGE